MVEPMSFCIASGSQSISSNLAATDALFWYWLEVMSEGCLGSLNEQLTKTMYN